MNKITFLGALALLVFTACKEDRSLEEINKVQAVTVKKNYDSNKNLIVIRGLKSHVKEVTYSEKSEFLENSYRKGFLPLKVSSEIKDENLYRDVSNKLSNISRMKIFENKRSIYSKTIEAYDDSETFIGDEDFASLLNDKGQIQVNDSIYMYTPNGLFMAYVDDYDNLEEFITENPQVTASEGYNRISNTIASYAPEQEFLNSFEMMQQPVDQLMIMPEDPEYGGGGGGGYVSPSIPTTTPSNYYNCNAQNANTPFIANWFGNQYVCEYFFSGDKKVKNVFEVLDFYLFNSVRAKTKMREKGWTGIWDRETADKLYLKINTAVFQIERKSYTVSTSVDWQTIASAYKSVFGQNQQSVGYVSEEYVYNQSTQKYDKKVYYIQNQDFNYMNADSVFQPNYYDTSEVANIGDYRNMMNTGNKDVIIVVNILNLEGSPETTLEKVIKLAKPLWSKYISQGVKPSQIAIAMNELSIYKQQNNLVDVKPLYVMTKDELVTATYDDKVIYDFDIKKDFNLEGMEIGFSQAAGSSPKFKLKVVLGYNKVTKFSVDMEGGAFYQNRWGGSTFSVTKQ